MGNALQNTSLPKSMTQQKRKFKGIWIPAEIWESENISKVEALFLAEIDSLDVDDAGCFASNAYLAKFFKMDIRQVQRYLKKLESKGLVKIENPTGKNRKLRIVNHDINVTPTMTEMSGIPRHKRHPYNIVDNKFSIVAAKSGVTFFPPLDRLAAKMAKEAYDREPMTLPEFVAWCHQSLQRHIQIIGDWAETVEPDLKTRGQWEAYIKRNVRPAKLLEPFDIDQLKTAYAKIEKAESDGWLSKKTLETLFKFLT